MTSIVAPPPMAGAHPVFDRAFQERMTRARNTAVRELLAARCATGGWAGELSSSALSTATAITALALQAGGGGSDAERAELRALVSRGRAWLVAHQNADGGWGDTTDSISNLSTTTLVWAALGLTADAARETGAAVSAAEDWITRNAGSIEPARLVRAIEDSYGADRTFSIPILTMCALCGRLGPPAAAWGHVRQLPFELAALPQRSFAALKLPVVSYALPALIAIGQVRHGMRPTRNAPLRWLRNRVRRRTLDKLGSLQPPNGGFLEATPLTSFVVMSLAALGLYDHEVVRRGVAFLRASIRGDGSWPIDTNLATWVTTLAVNAMSSAAVSAASDLTAAGSPDGPAPGSAGVPPATTSGAHERDSTRSVSADEGPLAITAADRATISRWLLNQQFRNTHPYTLAAPGGWAWTDLPGGVPDADDTAGALLALHRLGDRGENTIAAARAGVTWLLDLQNRDGGIPTFCRGWGTLPFDRSSPDLTAHAIRAWTAWRDQLEPAGQTRVDAALGRAAAFLRDTQSADGAWVPLWFGNQRHPAGENPVYGTARVIPALCDLRDDQCEHSGAFRRALDWLVHHQNGDGGWSGAREGTSSVEETAVALEALACAWRDVREPAAAEEIRVALHRGAAWLVDAIETNRWRTASPIGLYFAQLWYSERLYPVIFTSAALVRLCRLV